MGNILLMGTSNVLALPEEVQSWLQIYTEQGHQFIVGDKHGADCTFHRILSAVGAVNQSTIYCMGEVKNNLYELKVRSFNTDYSAEQEKVTITDSYGLIDKYEICGVKKEMDIQNTREWYEFLNKQMIDDCDIAIIVWDGESKTILKCIQLMNIKNKPCYSFIIPT